MLGCVWRRFRRPRSYFQTLRYVAGCPQPYVVVLGLLRGFIPKREPDGCRKGAGLVDGFDSKARLIRYHYYWYNCSGSDKRPEGRVI